MDREKATDAVFRINAHVEGLSGAGKKITAGTRTRPPVKTAPRPQKRQSIDDFLSHRSSFSAAELIAALEIDADKAEELIAKLLESGVIMMHGAGNYAVLS
jgi:predicted HTH transcriptional regulator